jgi:hypothetical protein
MNAVNMHVQSLCTQVIVFAADDDVDEEALVAGMLRARIILIAISSTHTDSSVQP